ncbi:MAG TPA: TetR family transcriptional regulator [Polyangiaceae bacterium]
MRVNPEKKEEKERVTLALLRATLKLAAAHGFSSLGLREVSRAADIAPTSFYRHFSDMEELGLALIEDLAGHFVEGVVERSRSEAPRPFGAVENLATAALAGVKSDPELLRFILAERVGAIPSFRAALGRVLAPLGSAIEHAFTEELSRRPDGPRRADVASAGVSSAGAALLLHACGRGLDVGPEELNDVREHFLSQMRMLFRGADLIGRD